MDKKYELLPNDTKKLLGGKTVYRIRALRDFADVKAGDLGGYIEHERNLSHDGNCWVYDEAVVCSNARLVDYAKAKHRSRIGGNALLRHSSKAEDRAQIYGNVVMYSNSVAKERAELGDMVELFGNSVVKGQVKLCNRVQLYHDVVLAGDFAVSAGVFKGDAHITNAREFVVFYNTPLDDDMLTVYMGLQGLQLCYNHTFFATLDEFVNMAKYRWFDATVNELVALIEAVTPRLNKAQSDKSLEG